MESILLFGLCILVLMQPRLFLPTKLFLVIGILWIIYRIREQQDFRSAKPLSIEKLTPGTFISYSFRKILEQDLTYIVSARLLGQRYMHMALVVEDRGERRVIEWRLRHVEEFRSYRIESAALGYIYSIPLVKYIEVIRRNDVVFKVFHPPRPLSIPLKISKIQEQKDKLLICTKFVFHYINSILKRPLSSRFYIPSFCMEELKKNGWREEYYIYQ